MTDRFRQALAARSEPWIEVHGSRAKRLAAARAAIEPSAGQPDRSLMTTNPMTPDQRLTQLCAAEADGQPLDLQPNALPVELATQLSIIARAESLTPSSFATAAATSMILRRRPIRDAQKHLRQNRRIPAEIRRTKVVRSRL